MVTASARGRKSKPSRIKSVGPICAPGPKHPQLIVRPRWYAEYIAMMNAQINTVERSPEIRSATPVSNHSPSKSSNGGSSRANGLTAQGGSEYRLIGEHRQFAWAYDAPPPERGRQGAGSVHHIAWASRDEDHLAWQRRVREAGPIVTEVLDRQYFKSIYFREPRGILFEIATLSPGFAVDEDPDHLGEELELPEMHEQLRPQLVRRLTPIVNPRVRRRQAPEP